MSEDKKRDVTQESSTAEGEVADSQEQEESEERDSQGAKGDATPENRLYAALEEERQLRKKLQKELQSLKKSSDDDITDSDATAVEKLERLSEKIASLERRVEMDAVLSKYPQLKEKLTEFGEYRDDLPDLPLDRAATLYLAENGLLSNSPKRKGLEKAGGGDKSPQPIGMTTDELRKLRTEQPRKYIQMIRSGKINP